MYILRKQITDLDYRLIVPEAERCQILELLHYGHYGIKRTQDRAKESVLGPDISRDIENKVKDRAICQENSTSQIKEPMHSHDVPKKPWMKLGIDLFEHHKKYYILIVDYFSKFPIIRKLHSLSTGTVISELKESSVKMAFLKLSSQMEDHSSDLSSETLHENGDSSIFNPPPIQ